MCGFKVTVNCSSSSCYFFNSKIRLSFVIIILCLVFRAYELNINTSVHDEFYNTVIHFENGGASYLSFIIHTSDNYHSFLGSPLLLKTVISVTMSFKVRNLED